MLDFRFLLSLILILSTHVVSADNHADYSPYIDVEHFKMDLPSNIASLHQERAYSYPIWYTP
jgi:hypothetical protein